MKPPMSPHPTPPLSPAPRRQVKAEAPSRYLMTLLAGEELKGQRFTGWGGMHFQPWRGYSGRVRGIGWGREGLVHLPLVCHYLSV